jgi:hypothetical protein
LRKKHQTLAKRTTRREAEPRPSLASENVVKYGVIIGKITPFEESTTILAKSGKSRVSRGFREYVARGQRSWYAKTRNMIVIRKSW